MKNVRYHFGDLLTLGPLGNTFIYIFLFSVSIPYFITDVKLATENRKGGGKSGGGKNGRSDKHGGYEH